MFLFWPRGFAFLHFEQGTDNFLLQCAYEECKANEYEWLKRIRNCLQVNGLGSNWSNKSILKKSYVKHVIIQRLQDQHVQKYREYINLNKIFSKTKVLSICNREWSKYEMRPYLRVVEDPQIRSHITRLRIDSNNLADCKYRSFRFKDQESDICNICKEKETVEHRILYCKADRVTKARNKFFESMSKSVPDINNRISGNDYLMLRLVLNVYPIDKENANVIGIICNFIRNVY